MEWLVPNTLFYVDNFLDPIELQAVKVQLMRETYLDVDIKSEFDIWRLNYPLNPVVGTTMFWPHQTEYREVLDKIGGLSVYPMGNAYDKILSKVDSLLKESGIIATMTNEVAGLIASVYCYKPGCRLVWHSDDSYLAAFSAYFSPWSENQGGYFAYHNEYERKTGVAHVVEPRSNRLLVFDTKLRHSVTICAPDSANDRLSISGFIVSRRKAKSLFEAFLRDITKSIQ